MPRKVATNSDASATEPSPRVLLARRIALWSLVGCLGILAFGLGFARLKQHVDTRHALVTEPPVVVLRNRPAWMNDYLAQRILDVARPTEPASVFDPAVLRGVHDRLLADPATRRWILSVNHVRRVYGQRPGDTIEVDATFRVPAALVKLGNDFWLVDSQGVRLESIPADQVTRVVLGQDGRLVVRVIDGVTRPPPEPGQSVPADLAAGLALLKVLHDKPFASEIVKVNVANYNGRRDASTAHLVLVTRQNTEVRWGRPVNTPNNFGEVDDTRKLLYMDRIVAEFGRVDARRPWVDLRFDRPLWPRVEGTDAADGASMASDTR